MATISIGLTGAFGNLGWSWQYLKHDNIGNNVKHPFKYSIDIPLNNDILEFPALCKATILQILSSGTAIDRLILPLDSVRDYFTPVKTADTMIKYFFNSYYYHKLVKYTNGKGINYYGHQGIILDKDFNILMCIFYRLQWDRETIKGKFLQPILKINPLVFKHQQEFMSKAIIQKIIPLSLNTVSINSCVSWVDAETFPNHKIVVEDMNDLLKTPTPPLYNENINDVLNQVLIDNMSDLDSFRV